MFQVNDILISKLETYGISGKDKKNSINRTLMVDIKDC